MNTFSKFFEDLLKILAAISLILLIAGYIDLKTYYSHFGVNISAYISTSEIILGSLDNLSIVILSLLFHIIIWFSFFNYLFDYTPEDVDKYWERKRRPIKYSDDFTVIRFIKNKKIILLLLISFISIIIASTLRVIFPNNLLILQLSLFALINFFLVTIIYLTGIHITRFLWIILKKQKTYNPKLVIAFLIFFPTLILTIWIKNTFSANRIRKYGNSEKVQLLLQNDSKIIANDSIRYLGRTENYFFFWNKNNDTTTVYPTGQIKQIFTSIVR